MRIAKMGKRCMFVEIFMDDEKSDGIYFGREPLWCSSCTLGQDPHSENPKETENSIPPFALPPLPNPAGEIWHFSLSQSAAKIQFLKSIKKSELIFPYFSFIATIEMYKNERVANLAIWQVDIKMTYKIHFSGKSKMVVRSCSNATVATAWLRAHLVPLA